MAKRIRISADDVTYTTLPGNTAELRNEAGELTDTIFGQDFESGETGLITGTLNTNALYKGFAGYIVNLKKTGTSTPLVDEAMSQVGTTQTYQVTDTAKQVLDIATAIVVEDNAVAVSETNIESIDFLFGKVTFADGYVVTGPVTIASGAYLPLTAIAGAKTFNLTQTAQAIDDTDIPTAKANDGFRIFSGGLKTVSMEIGGLYKTSNAFLTALQARQEIIVEINPDGNNLSACRGIFKYMSQGQSGDVGALEEETITLRLSVPDNELWLVPFSWNHAALSTLNQGVRDLLDAWQNGTKVYAHYLPDGITGQKWEAVVTDLSLAGGLESMNEFTVNLQLSGAPSAVA